MNNRIFLYFLILFLVFSCKESRRLKEVGKRCSNDFYQSEVLNRLNCGKYLIEGCSNLKTALSRDTLILKFRSSKFNIEIRPKKKGDTIVLCHFQNNFGGFNISTCDLDSSYFGPNENGVEGFHYLYNYEVYSSQLQLNDDSRELRVYNFWHSDFDDNIDERVSNKKGLEFLTSDTLIYRAELVEKNLKKKDRDHKVRLIKQ